MIDWTAAATILIGMGLQTIVLVRVNTARIDALKDTVAELRKSVTRAHARIDAIIQR